MPLALVKNRPTCNAISIGSNFGHHVAIFALVTNLATRWHHLHKLQIWPPDGATCISSKFGHHMAPLTLVANLATRWRYLHWLRIWPPDGTTGIDSKVGHQVTSHALPHCLGLPFWHYQLVLSLYLHQLESHQLSLHKVSHSLSEFETTGSIDRTRDTWVR